MSDKTKQILIIIAGVVIAVLIVLFAVALYQGTASVPGEVQAAAWGLLIAAIGAGSVYLNTRSNAITRQNSDRNAQETQAKVQEVGSHIAQTTANLVTQQADVVAAKVAETLTPDPTLQRIEEHTAEIAKNTDPEVKPS